MIGVEGDKAEEKIIKVIFFDYTHDSFWWISFCYFLLSVPNAVWRLIGLFDSITEDNHSEETTKTVQATMNVKTLTKMNEMFFCSICHNKIFN